MDANNNNLIKFLDAQNQMYLKALSEIKNGKKITHWMWYIFPQIKGLGHSETAKFYAIQDLDEAADYLAHPVLGKHLIEITNALLTIEGRTASDIFGSPDDMKLRSSLTLFANCENTHPVFQQALEKYFQGLQDELTLQRILKNKFSDDFI